MLGAETKESTEVLYFVPANTACAAPAMLASPRGFEPL